MARSEPREYELAVLQVLKDGQPHSREELMRAGCAAIDPHYALAMYQKARKGTAERRFDGMSQDERFKEIERQRYEGAKLQVSKNLSHIVDRHLAEVAEYGPSKTPGKRGPVLSLRITDRGRERLGGATDEEIDANWQENARRTLREVAASRPTLTLDDLWDAGVPQLKNNHMALTALMTWGKRHGLIQATDELESLHQVWRSLVCDQDAETKTLCIDCSGPADPTEPGSAYEVVGFLIVRPDPGGANQILFPEERGNVLCPSCVEARKHSRNRARRQRPL